MPEAANHPEQLGAGGSGLRTQARGQQSLSRWQEVITIMINALVLSAMVALEQCDDELADRLLILAMQLKPSYN